MNLTPMLMDETHAECAARVRSLETFAFQRTPQDHDAHVTAWIVEEFAAAQEAAEQRRRNRT